MSDTVEFLRNQIALRLAALEPSLAPYIHRPDVRAFQKEATERLRAEPVHMAVHPEWAERCIRGLNKTVATIDLNCKLIALGHNPPGWNQYEWNVLATLAGMQECDMEDDAQAYQLLVILDGRAREVDAAERRRATSAHHNESHQAPQEPQRVEKNDAEQPKSADEFSPYRIEGQHLFVESFKEPVKLTANQRKTLAFVIAAGEEGAVLSKAAGVPPDYSNYIRQIKDKLAVAELPDYIRTPGDDGKGVGGVYAIRRL
ncbi:hypothetical protein J8F10_24500 [Gemmata sp. G18]|uniref:DUF3987 domain-containing protein n=1 Tax=Gemmata palustris TaxID=2822762 RepID=A0ABS5BYD6_9BACT|nr:hypothetical protein [Gemmata palustris]MBP3958422.1 hypothetical protein [Gemmata palustris]